MSTIYDSRGFVKRLTEAGMQEQQADTLASENLLLIAEHLATKDDFKSLESSIDHLRTEMRAEFRAIYAKLGALDTKLGAHDIRFDALDAKLSAIESRIVAKLGALMAAMVATVAAILRFA